MAECVKCGRDNEIGAQSCGDCAWPLTLNSWRFSARRVERVTIDTNCINQRRADQDLNTIERWGSERKFVIERAPAMLNELKGAQRIAKAQTLAQHRDGWILGVSALGIDTYLAGPNMETELVDVLFPTTAVLNGNQRADVEHLRSHIQTGADIFLTRDAGDFIVGGKRDELLPYGIWILSPREFVLLCQEAYAWV